MPMKRGQPCPVWHREGIDNSALATAKSLEEAVAVLVTDPIYHPQWVLPPWLGKVKWLQRACPEAIEEFCRDLCGLPEVPRIGIRNESSSPGWEAAPLSADMRKLVDESTEVRAWDEFPNDVAESIAPAMSGETAEARLRGTLVMLAAAALRSGGTTAMT